MKFLAIAALLGLTVAVQKPEATPPYNAWESVEDGTDSETLDDGTKIGGEPTGKFWMTKSTTLAASKEVLNTHKGLSGGALASSLDTYFDKAWAHFDVNKGGDIEVIKMPQFMRFLASDQYMSLGESG